MEDCHTRGSDVLAHARAPGNARRMHQVGHVGGKRSLQSVPQKRLDAVGLSCDRSG